MGKQVRFVPISRADSRLNQVPKVSIKELAHHR
uniref:Uncharacterized protein n=1 Tax=Arundo donax TaxID=35708 RepID=A0A0A8Y944_ARUDO